MYKKISALITILFFVSIVSFFFYYNAHEVTVRLGSESTYTLPLALVLISSFFLGVIFVTLFATFLGLKFKLEQWKLARQMKLKDSHYEDLKKAHDLLSLKDADGARSLLQKILQKDPHDILSRLALAKTYLIQKRPDEALKLLESARAEERKSPALLVTIAEAQGELGNYTAAHDSILLALREYPKNIFLLDRAVTLSKKLGKLGDAKFLIDELMKVSPYAEQEKISEISASLHLQEAKKLKLEEPALYEAELQKIIKNHKEYIPAQIEFANVLFEKKESDQAVKILRKALSKHNSVDALKKLLHFWLSTENPSQALSTLKEAIQTGNQEIVVAAHALLAQTLLHLEHTEEAREEIKALEKLFSKDPEKSLFLLALTAKLDAKSPGKSKTNLPLESILIKEAESAGLPALSGSVIHPAINEEHKNTTSVDNVLSGI